MYASTKKYVTIAVAFMLVGSIFIGLASMSEAADTNPKPMADWTVSGSQTINGYIHYQRGNVIIPAGATLTIMDGGLVFQQDLGDDGILGTADDHIYSLSIAGTLIMQNSLLSTQLNEIYDYPKLTLTMSAGGTLQATDSTLQFPGTFTATSANIVLTGSTITGHNNYDIDRYIGNFDGVINSDKEDDANDAPIMIFSSSTVQLYDSRVEKIYENAFSPNPNAPLPDYRYDITLTGNTAMTIVDSYVGIDMSPSTTKHNTLLANGTVIAPTVYIYNMTIDESQTPAPASRKPALIPWGPVTFNSFSSNVTAFGASHTATGVLANLYDDDVNYVVAAPGQRIFADDWTIPGFQFVSALLRVTYSTDLGYNGTQPVMWALDGQPLQPTTIIPADTLGMGLDVTETYDLFAQGMDTIAELQTLDVTHYNDATVAANVYWDLMRVDVTYLFVDSDAVFYINKWLDLTVTDEFNVPAYNTAIDSYRLPTGPYMQYPDNGNSLWPPNNMLNYLGKTQPTFNVTDNSGGVLIPLLTDIIDRTAGIGTMPNSEFVGNYRIRAAFLNLTEGPAAWYYGFKNISFTPYPAMTFSDNTLKLKLQLPDVQIPRPDLSQNDCRYVPSIVYENDIVSIQANVTNIGDSPALDVFVTFYEGPNMLYNETISSVNAGSYVLTMPFDWNGTTVGTHLINIKVDPLGTVSEKNEGNNNKGCSIVVNPNRPNLKIDSVNISHSPNPVPNNVVDISAQISNTGRENATDVLTYFYVDDLVNDIAEGGVDNSSVMDNVPAADFNGTTVGWIPPASGIYEICVKVDPLNAIVEDDENDNFACAPMVVNPAPNLFVSTYDIMISDPFPKQGDTVTIEAMISNIGYADSTATFNVTFRVDGLYLGSTFRSGLAAGNSVLVPGVPLNWNVVSYGWHTVTVTVDTTDAEYNETNEKDNTASRQVFAYRHPKTWYVNNLQSYDVDITCDCNIEIRGELTISNANLVIDQNESRMHVVKILDNGVLRLNNATITGRIPGGEEYPLVVYVTDSGKFISGSQVLLDAAGEEGLIYTDGNSELWLWDSEVDASIRATGSLVDIRNSDLMGSSIYIDTQQTTIIWDTAFTGVTSLQLVSDDSNPNSVDFNLRNITFNQLQTSQLRFIGDQYVIFTNVDTYVSPGKDWYDGMIMENARIARYWWLTVRNVDGIGNPIGTPDISRIAIQRLEFDNLTQTYNWITELAVITPSGIVVHEALSEIRYALPDPHSTDYTYHLEGNVTVGVNTYYPDEQKNVSVIGNMVVDLKYSKLTPDLSIEKIEFGGPGAGKRRAVDMTLYLNATIKNSGFVAASNVEVHFFAFSLINIPGNGQDGYVSYQEAQAQIAFVYTMRVEPIIPANGNVTVSATYFSNAITLNAPTISVFVDVYNKLAETDETNNEDEETFEQIFGWPDYWVKDIATIPSSVAVNTPVEIRATIKNLGRGPGTGAIATYRDGPTLIGTVNLADLAAGAEMDAVLIHNFATSGSHIINVSVNYTGPDITRKDYNMDNNRLSEQVSTYTQADLTITNMEIPPGEDVVVNSTFLLNVTVSNLGQADAINFNVSVYYDSINDANRICIYEGMTLPDPLTSLSTFTIQITCANIPRMGTVTLHAFADSGSVIYETDEANNNATLDVDVEQRAAEIIISSPTAASTINAGATVNVIGYVNSTAPPILPIANVQLTIRLRAADQTIAASIDASTGPGGLFTRQLEIPDNLAQGSYDLCVADTSGSIPEHCITVTIAAPPEEFPWWIIFLIIIIVIIVIVATIVYLRYRGLGKMVECGECGALIPEGSTKCPKCGVEFEADTVKCSSCGAWIPSDVKNCPECGVEFVVGEVKAEDYQARMRKQYDQLVNKFREQARRDLGASFTEDQFQGWWRAQPTYISFQQWLREEEEKKKMGSAPCPTCGTLNSVTAKICHRCGTPLKKVEQPEERAPPARPPAAPPGPPPSEEQATPPPTTPVPKKVVKKPMVPKRVVIRKPGEPPEEEGR